MDNRFLYFDKWSSDRQQEFIAYLTTHSCMETAQKFGLSKSSVTKYFRLFGVVHDQQTLDRLKKKSIDMTKQYQYSEKGRKNIYDLNEHRKALFKKESRRVELGLPQNTRIRISTIPKNLRRKVAYAKYRLRKLGYHVVGNESYYDENTKRTNRESYYHDRLSIHFIRLGDDINVERRNDVSIVGEMF